MSQEQIQTLIDLGLNGTALQQQEIGLIKEELKKETEEIAFLKASEMREARSDAVGNAAEVSFSHTLF